MILEKNHGKILLLGKFSLEKLLLLPKFYVFFQLSFPRHRSLKMDPMAVPRTILEEVAAAQGGRVIWEDQYTRVVTDWARQFGIKGAIERHKKGDQKEKVLPWSTVDRWLQVMLFS